MGIIPSQTPPAIIRAKEEKAEKEKEKKENTKKIENKEDTEKVISFPLYWDSRDKYSDVERELLERISNANDYIGKKIYVTELGTVCKKTNGYVDESSERIFGDFVKETEQKILQDQVKIKYDEVSNKFYLIDREKSGYVHKIVVHEIDVNSDSMKAYFFGEYDEITSSLHNLYLKTKFIEERKQLERNKEEERKAIIAKSNTSHEELSPAEAIIYLDYLEELKETNAKVIRKDVGKIATTAATPLSVGIANGVLLNTLTGATVADSAVVAFGTAAIAILLVDGYLYFKKDVEPAEKIPFIMSKYIQDLISEIKGKKYENKVINFKAQKLGQIENIDKMVVAKSYYIEDFDSTLEANEKLGSPKPKDSIIKNLTEIVTRAKLLNPDDKAAIIIKANEILDEYTARYIAIVNQDKDSIDLDADSFEKLKDQMIAKIAILEMELNEARQRDIQIKPILDESRQLAEKIDGLIDLDVQRVREISQNKVKVNKLERKNMSLLNNEEKVI